MTHTPTLAESLFIPAFDPAMMHKELEPWSAEIANQMAAKEGMHLTLAHMEVLDALRNHYFEYGQAASARDLMHCISAEFEQLGGKKYLFSLFPKGPVTQGCRLAGLPPPPNSVDRSFGTAM